MNQKVQELINKASGITEEARAERVMADLLFDIKESLDKVLVALEPKEEPKEEIITPPPVLDVAKAEVKEEVKKVTPKKKPTKKKATPKKKEE